MNDEVRTNLRRTWLECLHEFATTDVERGWATGSGGEFVELMCCYFDDLGLQGGLEKAVEQGLLSPAEAQATAELHRFADAYEPRSDSDPDVLNDPRWSAIVRVAGAAWSRLYAILDDPTECAYMESMERFRPVTNSSSPGHGE